MTAFGVAGVFLGGSGCVVFIDFEGSESLVDADSTGKVIGLFCWDTFSGFIRSFSGILTVGLSFKAGSCESGSLKEYGGRIAPSSMFAPDGGLGSCKGGWDKGLGFSVVVTGFGCGNALEFSSNESLNQ